MRPLRLALTALVLTACPAAATPTFDVPDVRRHLSGSVTTYVVGNDRAVYRVSLYASVVNAESTTPYSWVELYVAKCAKTCAVPVRYFAELKPAQYSATDPGNWGVATTAFGRPLAARWTAGSPSGDLDTDPALVGTDVDLSQSWTGTGSLTVLGRTCFQKGAPRSRHTTVYSTGFLPPVGFVPMPARAPLGQPSSAKACRVAL